MQELRRIIRSLILEVKPLTPKELEKRKQIGLDADRGNSADQRRVYGLQDVEEQEADRTLMQQYHAELHGTPEGKALIKRFQTGEGVTVVHSIGYQSVASRKGIEFGKRDKRITGIPTPIQRRGRRRTRKMNNRGSAPRGSVQRWKGQYARMKSQKDQISAVAWEGTLGEKLPSAIIGEDNMGVILEGVGFVLRGYPAIISRYDMMTQTLGSLTRDMVKHQKQSGIAKRVGETDGLITKPGFEYAGEVALDNWNVHGIMMNLGAMDGQGDIGKSGDRVRVWLEVFWDALHTNMPVYVYEGLDFVGEYKGAKEEYLLELENKVMEFKRKSDRHGSLSMRMMFGEGVNESRYHRDGKKGFKIKHKRGTELMCKHKPSSIPPEFEHPQGLSGVIKRKEIKRTKGIMYYELNIGGKIFEGEFSGYGYASRGVDDFGPFSMRLKQEHPDIPMPMHEPQIVFAWATGKLRIFDV